MTRFICPACGFRIFMRRLGKCESCGAPLPEELQLSPKQFVALEEEDKRIEKIREDLARKADAESRKRQSRRGDGG